MGQLIASVIVNGNEVQLIKEYGNYYIYWGEVKEHYKSKTKLLTSSGRNPSQSSAYKKFLKAADAAQYLKFEKL